MKFLITGKKKKTVDRIFHVLLGPRGIWFTAALITGALLFYGNNGLQPIQAGGLRGSIAALTDSFKSVEGLSVILVYTFIWWFLTSCYKKTSVSRMAVLFGIMAGGMSTLGRNYLLNEGMSYIVNGGWMEGILSFLTFIGFSILFSVLFEVVWDLLSRSENKEHQGSKLQYFVFDKHPFLCCLIIIILCWLPYLIAFYPGILHYDALTALDEYYGDRTWTTHFPPLTVLMLGFSMDLGKSLGSDNIGCTIYMLPQFFAFAVTLAYSFVIFKRWNSPYWIRILSLLAFLVYPAFPMYGIMAIKETYFYIAFLWLVYAVIMYTETKTKKWLWLASVAAFFLCAIRKDGKFLCLFVIICFLVSSKWLNNGLKKLSWHMLTGAVIAVLFTQVLCSMYQISPGSEREALSAPVQQTARYIRDHSEDITPEEWETLDTFFSGHAHELGKLYDPNISDPVKFKVVYHATNEQFFDYIKVWAKHFLRHPECYFSATFNNTYGYFYIDKPEYYSLSFSTSNPKPDQSNYYGDIVVEDNPKTEGMREDMVAYFTLLSELPIIKLLYHTALYTWFIMIAITYILKKRKYIKLPLYSLPVGVLLICCLSPLNGANRYYFPVTCSCFILLAYSLYTEKRDAVKESEMPGSMLA